MIRNAKVSSGQLRAICPNLSADDAESMIPYINVALVQADITLPKTAAAFIAQCSHESDHFRTMEEYASGRNYEGRTDLGNIVPGDGVRYRGRGVIQITGRNNYAAASKALGVDFVNNPKLAGTIDNAWRIAAWFWSVKGCSKLLYTKKGFDSVTLRINGSYNGKASRDELFAKACIALGV